MTAKGRQKDASREIEVRTENSAGSKAEARPEDGARPEGASAPVHDAASGASKAPASSTAPGGSAASASAATSESGEEHKGRTPQRDGAPTGNPLTDAARAQIYAAALADAELDAIVFNEGGTLVHTTLDADDPRAASLIEYARDHRAQAAEQGRLLLNRDGRLYTLLPRTRTIEGHALSTFTVRTRRTHTVRAGIEWLNAEDVQADFEQSAFGVIEGAESLSPLVLQAYDRRVPVMLEGEAGAGKDQTAHLLYLRGSARDQPFVRVSCDLIADKNWRWLLRGADSPLYQTNMTIYLRGLHALGEKRCRELLACVRDTALTERCRVILSGNDVPGGGECDAVAAFAEQLRCAVCIAAPVRERADRAACVERYLSHVSAAFEVNPPALSAEAREVLNAYRWPRNYTQVREVAERLLIVSEGGVITAELAREVLAQEGVIRSGVFSSPALETDLYILRPLADTERDIAQLVCDHLGGNKTRAAEVLGISRTTLWRLLR